MSSLYPQTAIGKAVLFPAPGQVWTALKYIPKFKACFHQVKTGFGHRAALIDFPFT